MNKKEVNILMSGKDKNSVKKIKKNKLVVYKRKISQISGLPYKYNIDKKD